MNIYLEEYINEDIYQLLKKDFHLVKDIKDAECIISRCLIVDKALMDKAPHLKCIAMYGTGVDAIDIDYAHQKGIAVFNAPKQNCLSVAELNVGLMLAISRHFENAGKDVKERGIIDYKANLGHEISGKTVGFIGVGKISEMTARMLKYGFGCNIFGYNRSKKDIDYITMTDMNTLLKISDYVILGLALNEETKGILDLAKISLMKKSAILVNATRGALVNHDDIVYALKNNLIAGYAADAFETEPIAISDPLLKENVFATPHIGGNTVESLYRVGYLLYEEIKDFEAGKKPEFLI